MTRSLNPNPVPVVYHKGVVESCGLRWALPGPRFPFVIGQATIAGLALAPTPVRAIARERWLDDLVRTAWGERHSALAS